MRTRDVATVVLLMLGLQAGASAQGRLQAGDSDYPSRPIRVVAGWPAGGGSDVVVRLLASQLSQSLGQQIIIDNRPGAGNSIASAIVAKAPPNGYTLQFVNANHTLNPFVYGKLPYDTERDFAPISQVTRSALVLVVSASFPVASLKDLIAMAKDKPHTLSAGTSGTAGAGAVTTEMFKLVSGMDFLVVPYKGGAPAMIGLLQGEVQFAIATQATAMGYIKNGRLKVLASSSEKRLPHMPDVPTFLELGLAGLDLGPWEGVIAPAKTPRVIIDRLYRELAKALKQPDVLANFAAQGVEPVGSTPDEFAARIRHQLDSFGRIFKDGKIVGSR